MQKFFLEKYPRYLIFFPILLCTGPFLTDLMVSVSALIFISIFIDIKHNLAKLKKISIFLIFFWILFVINSLLSDHILFSLKSSFLSIRFILFSFIIYYFFSNNDSILEKFNFILKSVIIFLCIDALFQYFFGFNFFGFEREPRLSGVFRSEWILGSFLSKMYALMVTLDFLYQEKNFTKKKIIQNFLILILVYVTIILTFERAAFIFLNLYIFSIFIFIKKFRKFFFILLGIIFLMNIFFLTNINHYKNRYIKNFFYQLNTKNSNFILLKDYSDLFKTSYAIFTDNKINGIGNKNFRNGCKKYLDDFPKGCSTHPHNYYAQFMSENGLSGILFISISFLYFFFLLIKYLNINDDKYKNFCISSCIILLLILQPLTTTGSFFHNWNASLVSLIFGVSLLRKKFE